MEHKLYTLTVKTFKFRINFFHFFTLQIWKPTIFIDILKKIIHSARTLHVGVFYGSQNKELSFPISTAMTEKFF